MTIFVAAGHKRGMVNASLFIDEVTYNIKMTNMLVRMGKYRGRKMVKVPHALDLAPSIAWVNARSKPGDIALEIHFNGAAPNAARGAMCIYTIGDNHGKGHAWSIIAQVKKIGFPQFSKGVYTDRAVAQMRGWERLGWHNYIRRATAILHECGFVTSSQDAKFFRSYWNRRKYCRAILKAI